MSVALSIRQPWAWLIVRPDLTDPTERLNAAAAGEIKDIENRDWPTKFRGRVLIHAGKGMTMDEYAAAFVVAEELGVTLPAPERLQRGGIIGEAEVVACVSSSDSPWFFGDYGFVLRKSMPLPFRPCRGMFGFFQVPEQSEESGDLKLSSEP